MGWALRTGLLGGAGAIAATAFLLLSSSPVFAAGGTYGDGGGYVPSSATSSRSVDGGAASLDLLGLAGSLLVREVSAGGATLGWAAGTGGADVRFAMEVAPVGGASTRVSLPVGSSLGGLQPSTTYQYRILAIDSAGNQAVGPDMVFQTAAAPTGGLPAGVGALPIAIPSLP